MQLQVPFFATRLADKYAELLGNGFTSEQKDVETPASLVHLSYQLSAETFRTGRIHCIVHLQTICSVRIPMGYKDLVESNISTPEMQAYLTDSELVAVTLRLPHTICDSAKEYATLNGLNFMSLVNQCLIEKPMKWD